MYENIVDWSKTRKTRDCVVCINLKAYPHVYLKSTYEAIDGIQDCTLSSCPLHARREHQCFLELMARLIYEESLTFNEFDCLLGLLHAEKEHDSI